MKRSRRLMWKIFIFLIGFCSLLLAVLWLFETMLLGKMYEGVRKNEIKNAIALIERNIDSPNLNQIIVWLADDSEIIVTPAHDFSPLNRPNPADKIPMRQAITESKDFITSDGRIVSFVFYAIISPVNATISTIKVQLYYVTGIMFLLSIALAFVIARTVSKPIEELNNSAKILASGNYDIHFSGKGYREIHELSDTLNYTAAELSKVDALRRELMANISHDLRTPLALIYSYAEMMHDFPNEITPEQTQMIMDESTRLSSLVGDILDISRLENGTIDLNIKTYNITESIRTTIDRMAELVKKSGYRFLFEHGEDIYVNADELKITQVFYNLLINAINYSDDDLTIIIRQKVFEGFVRIEIEDHGKGIAEENLPYIWDRYYRIDKTHRRAVIGTGLGLSIVKKVISLHGGSYGVESKIGKGSTFWFDLEINNM
ncbi:sensor histidine kinase [Lachnoclostridium phytofermentans]|uniref:histidine kinase n=1 Tax=Lachnoclostridium phytofermentans (strain ATCC 700394 / DSM 18823 / ISDg) TaxID=357809 RepID=A9KJT7_LACP7|nr:HAMP domain-containing sensor histidine kinase [Lachnoclostridium phytofermentans]ABX41092.1 integral membrane sensor signal transduction histidine kinase [Lachnoclostridium phytofermentans ISDg]